MARPNEGTRPAGKRGAPPIKSINGGAPKKQKFDKKDGHKPSGDQSQPKIKLDRKGQKQVALERKARRNKNFNLIQEVTALWETIRRKDTSAERRGDLVTSVLKKIDGRVAELAASHTASRIVQACVKYGTADQREKILAEVEPKILELSKSPYGRFVVSKMIDMAPKSEIPALLKAFKGHAAELLRHPAGAHVLDDLYVVANAAQRDMMAAEFYGREYSLFSGGTLNKTEGAPTSLKALLALVDAPKRRSIVQHLATSIAPVIEKGLVDCQLAHRLLAEYLEAAPASLVPDAVESLSGDALLHMIHTHQGVQAACMVLAYGTAKDRKKAIKALKGHVPAAVRDEWGHLALVTALSVVDDTALLRKFVVGDIQNELGELVPHKAAHRVLLQLLHPDKYLAPVQLSIVHPPEKVLAQGAGITAADSGSDSDDEGMDNAAEGSDEEGGKQEAGPLGASKKDPALRRKELLTGGLGEALCTFCAETGAALIASQYACDIVVEVCRGGEGGVLEAVVGKDAIDAVHAQVVDAAAAVPEEGEPLLESYFGSRAVQRIVQASEEEGPAGDAAGRFVDLLWSKALKGRCAALHGTHAGRVVQAVAECGRPAAAAGAKKELKGVTVKKAAPTKAVPEKAAVSKADKKKKPAK